MFSAAQRPPHATYRLQLRREFPFSALEAVVPYLEQLGISDCYCSPILLSGPGSSHGYDVADYRRIDHELGGRDGLQRLHAALEARGLGLLLDFVPNHMGINSPGLVNRWWQDVLEGGRHSPYARFFDIDWHAAADSGRLRILVPILDDTYGAVLEAGRFSLAYADGGFGLGYGDLRFPLSPDSYRILLEPLAALAPELGRLAAEFGALPRPDAREDADAARRRSGRLSELKRQLGAWLADHPEAEKLVRDRLADVNGTAGDPRSFGALHELIERQHYRLAYWRAGVHGTNYRRFFAIDSLVGVRIENPEVFQECHALVGQLVRDGIVTGLRIDHIDGLRDPEEYLQRLQGLTATRAESKPFYVAVEKILAGGESLPPSWAAHGTTGYEFIAQLAGLLVDPRAEAAFTDTYAAFCGETRTYDEIIYAKKRLVLEELFANAVTSLAHRLADVLQADRRWRDLTRHELTTAVRELMAGYGVYRTYRRGVEPMTETDRAIVERACGQAIRRNPRLGTQPFEFVRDVLTGAFQPEDGPPDLREQLAAWTLTFQQYTGAVMAKAVEDTAFYTYGRFIALNEVGGSPGRFGADVAAFHAANEKRLAECPLAMLATATHDTKLGEDARARLYTLSEIPHAWRDWLAEWSALNRRHTSVIDGRIAPDANEEYRLYQILLAAWPADDADPDETFVARLQEHLRKAVNEAKRNTTWIHPNDAWLAAGDRFLAGILHSETGREFLASFRPQARRLAHLGMVNSLAQVVLKVLSPGVPDFYQGCDLWDLSLVDPDNRRAVDFEQRQAVLAGLEQRSPTELLAGWRDGAIKLATIRTLLRLRRAMPEVFAQGGYRVLPARGRFAGHVVAFAREFGGRAVIAVVPRLTAKLGCPPLGLVWDDTTLAGLGAERRWRDVMTGRVHAGADALSLTRLFAELPFAVLVAEDDRAQEPAGP